MQHMVPAWTERVKVRFGKTHQVAWTAYDAAFRRHSTIPSNSDSPQCCSPWRALQDGAGQQSAGTAIKFGSQAGWEPSRVSVGIRSLAFEQCYGDHIMIGN